jgi:glutathione S-transferase
MRILGRANSINVQTAMWTCGELGLDANRLDIGGPFGINNTPEYLSKNPNGLVPALEEDDGFILWESGSIVRYLSEVHGKGIWYPTDIRQRALANQWMDWSLSRLMPAITPVFWGLVRTPPEERNHDLINAKRAESEKLMTILDRQLDRKSFLLGDSPCMADLVIGPRVYRWLHVPMERPARPNVEAYFGRLAERTAYREHVMLPMT